MDKRQIFLLIALFIFAGFKFYQKYVRKGSKSSDATKSEENSAGSKSGDDDYEPYSGK